MAMTTRYGNEIYNVDTAVFDESGQFVGAFCRRGDGARRYYRVMDLRHPDGIAGVMSELETAPNKITELECDTQEVY